MRPLAVMDSHGWSCVVMRFAVMRLAWVVLDLSVARSLRGVGLYGPEAERVPRFTLTFHSSPFILNSKRRWLWAT